MTESRNVKTHESIVEAVRSFNPDLNLGGAAFEALSFGSDPKAAPPELNDFMNKLIYPNNEGPIPDKKAFVVFRKELNGYATRLARQSPEYAAAIMHNLEGWNGVLDEKGKVLGVPTMREKKVNPSDSWVARMSRLYREAGKYISSQLSL